MARASQHVMTMKLLILFALGCGSNPKPEKMAPPPLGQSTAPGPSDPTVPPPDSNQMVPDKRTSMLDDSERIATDAAVPSDGLLPPEVDATNPPSTGSGAKLRGSATPQ